MNVAFGWWRTPPWGAGGLRWCYVDIDSANPTIEIAERALEVGDRYVGQAAPKTPRSRRRIGLHPLLVAYQLDDLVKVADLAGHVDTRTTEGYRHKVRASLPHAIDAWNRLFDQAGPSSPAEAV